MDITEVHASILLNVFPNLGPVRFQSLIERFGSAKGALEQGLEAWVLDPLFPADYIHQLKSCLDQAKQEAEEDYRLMVQHRVRIYMAHQGAYPRLLKHVKTAPPIIYAKGEDISVDRPSIAIVGSRRCSYYGEKMAARLSSDLASAGVGVVSGLARGIDTHAHRAAIKSNGKTWAVVGCGLSVVYPPENRTLAEEIAETGAVISEFPMKTTPFPANFPRRNRIIAGLTLGTVVVEGCETSGALITARLAAEEGRDVFAIPGPVTSALSTAPHRLLRMGAKMVESAADILEEFAKEDRDKLLTQFVPSQTSPLTRDLHQSILSLIGEEPLPRELVMERFATGTPDMPAVLLEMELMGLIKSVPGGMIIKN